MCQASEILGQAKVSLLMTEGVTSCTLSLDKIMK